MSFDRLIAAQAAVFGVAAVLSRFVQWPMPPTDLVRPLIAVVLVALVITGALRLLGRDIWWAPVAASAIVLLGLREPLAGGAMAAIAVWLPAVVLLRSVQRRPTLPPRQRQAIARGTAIFGLAYIAIMGWSAWHAHAGERPRATYPEYELAGETTPNVHLILLDGYPDLKTLNDVFAIDVAAFELELEELGFDVADNARSNYPNTWLTMASMLHGEYVEDLIRSTVPSDPDAQTRWLHSVIQESSVADAFRAHGYAVESVRSPVGSSSLMRADVFHAYELTDFEANLLITMPWLQPFMEPIGGIVLSAKDAHVREALDIAAERASAQAGPRLVLTHVQSPHPPFALSASERATLPSCFPECPLWSPTIQELEMDLAEYARRLEHELHALNSLVIKAVREIAVADPTAVTVVFSDHGLRYSFDDYGESFRTFLAVRAPGDEEITQEEATPVNVMRSILSEYFEVELEPLPYRAWAADWHAPLKLTPMPRSSAN